ncbi:hypothetical protein GS416_08730, partial [Rhodococcus hoagii]|nr:hypothetical protein [Prescottella equi]
MRPSASTYVWLSHGDDTLSAHLPGSGPATRWPVPAHSGAPNADVQFHSNGEWDTLSSVYIQPSPSIATSSSSSTE